MKGAEILRLQALTDELWPHSERSVDDDRLALRVQVWVEILTDVSPAEAEYAITSLAAEGREFAPPVGVIRKRALELRQQVTGQGGPPSGAEAWAEVLELIRARGWMFPPEPEHSSHPAVHRAVEVFGWMNLCKSETHMADRAHFIRFYEDVASTHRDHMATPAAALEATSQRVLAPGASVGDDVVPYEGEMP